MVDGLTNRAGKYAQMCRGVVNFSPTEVRGCPRGEVEPAYQSLLDLRAMFRSLRLTADGTGHLCSFRRTRLNWMIGRFFETTRVHTCQGVNDVGATWCQFDPFLEGRSSGLRRDSFLGRSLLRACAA